MEAKHSQLPWKQGDDGGHNGNFIHDAKGNAVAQVYGLPMHKPTTEIDRTRWRDGLDRMELIVRAVNSHAELVAACDSAIQTIEQLIPEPSARGVANVVLAQLRAALAKAEGGAA